MNVPVLSTLAAEQAPQRSVRTESLRLIDYSPYPRMDLEHGPKIGMSLNESDTGLCIVLGEEIEAGSMLRIVVRGVDGRPTHDMVTRVVWCKPNQDGRIRAGLAYLREGRARMLKVQHTQHRTQAVINA